MTTQRFVDKMNEIHSISPQIQEDILERSQIRRFRRSALLVDPNEGCKGIFYILKGCCRNYIYTEKNELTYFIGVEDNIVSIPQSYVSHVPNHEQGVEAIEELTADYISFEDIEYLCEKYSEVAYISNKILQYSYLYYFNEFISMLSQSAKERYTNLIKRQPLILQKVPLKYIADYLGITPETLSRIRAEAEQS